MKEKIESLRNSLASVDINWPGPSLKEKFVVFESDDWGSERMSSPESYKSLLKAGIPVDRSAYCRNDTLESVEDLTHLGDLLSSHVNRHGQSAKFTLNYVSANPDFDKIRDSDFQEYHNESIMSSYRRRPSSSGVMSLVHSGIRDGLWNPQFHGREHVNVPLWMSLLKSNPAYLQAFDQRVWGISRDVFPDMQKSVQATYDSIDLEYTSSSIMEGLKMFEAHFGFKSKSFIANNYIWDSRLFSVLREAGVQHLQSMKYQVLPLKGESKRELIRRNFGSVNDFGQTFAPRNCQFEPSESGHTHLDTLKQINIAFKLKKPAVISTHRMNYVSGMRVENRDDNLKELQLLLKAIIQRWPEVRFITSDELHDITIAQLEG